MPMPGMSVKPATPSPPPVQPVVVPSPSQSAPSIVKCRQDQQCLPQHLCSTSTPQYSPQQLTVICLNKLSLRSNNLWKKNKNPLSIKHEQIWKKLFDTVIEFRNCSMLENSWCACKPQLLQLLLTTGWSYQSMKINLLLYLIDLSKPQQR